MKHQHHCSSKILTYNTSIFYKLRQSYLIIDIEPNVDDNNKRPNDHSFFSLIKSYTSPSTYIFLLTNLLFPYTSFK
jgi:hypothetical protein